MVICVKGTKPFVELKENYPQILRFIIRKTIFLIETNHVSWCY